MIKYIIFSTFGLFLLGCKTIDPSKTKSNHNVTESDCEQFWLENRIQECESALYFMKAIIEPVENSVKLSKNNFIGNLEIQIRGDNNPKRIEGLGKIFINLNCLKSLNAKEIIALLCSRDDAAKLNDVLSSISPNHRIGFDVLIMGMEGFSFALSDNKITEISWHIITNSH